MKVLIAGAGKKPAIERYFADHLNELGVETRLFAAQNIFFDYYEKNILNKLWFKAGLSNIYDRINKLFRSEIETMKPDIVWVFKGMEIYPESLRWAKEKNIKLVNYNTDNPFIFSGKGSGNQNVIQSISLYDLHLTYDMSIQRRINEEYKISCMLLPFGFEDSNEIYEKCVGQQEVRSLCFVGSPDKKRAEFLEAVGSELPLAIYGPGWEKFINNPGITIHAPVHGDDFWMTLHRYRVQLNFMRPHNPDSHNMRSFEAPGIGSIMLAPATADHKRYFKEDEEIFLFSNVRECIDKARSLLDLPADKAIAIRRNAREKSIRSGYSYMGRARMVSKWFSELYEENSHPSL